MNLDQSSLLIFSIFPSLQVFVIGQTYSLYQYIYNLFDCQHYIIRFLSSSCQLEFPPLQVNYDRFGNGAEGTSKKPVEILTTKDRWSELLTYVTDVVQQEKNNNSWKSINTHTYTTAATILQLIFSSSGRIDQKFTRTFNSVITFLEKLSNQTQRGQIILESTCLLVKFSFYIHILTLLKRSKI